MLFVLAGWVLFRAANINTAMSVLGSLAGLRGIAGSLQEIPLLAAAAAVSVLVPSAHENKGKCSQTTIACCRNRRGRGVNLHFSCWQRRIDSIYLFPILRTIFALEILQIDILSCWSRTALAVFCLCIFADILWRIVVGLCRRASF